MTTRGTATTPSIRRIFAGLMLGVFVSSLNLTLIAPALSTIVLELGSIDQFALLAVAALVSSAIATPIAGKFGDLYGRRFLYVVGVGTLAAGSALGGVATAMPVLVLARLIQGAGTGIMAALAHAILGELIAPRERGRYQAALAAMFALATVGGPVIGGALLDRFSWRSLFLLTVPLAALVLLVIGGSLRRPPRPRFADIDSAGIVTLTIALLAGVIALGTGGSAFGREAVSTAGIVSVSALVLFMIVERRASQPLIPPALWGHRAFALSNLAGVGLASAMFAVLYYVPVFVQGVLGETATGAGEILVPLLLGQVSASIVSGQIVSWTGRYKLVMLMGAALTFLGAISFMHLGAASTGGDVALRMVILGAGTGSSLSLLTPTLQNAMRPEAIGVVTATLVFSRSVGSTVGVAVLGLVFQHEIAREIPARIARLHPTDVTGGVEILFDPAARASASPELVTALRDGLAAALHSVFFGLVPLAAAGLVAVALLREIPLARESGIARRRTAALTALLDGPGTAAPPPRTDTPPPGVTDRQEAHPRGEGL